MLLKSILPLLFTLIPFVVSSADIVTYENFSLLRVWSTERSFLLKHGILDNHILISTHGENPSHELVVAPEQRIRFISSLKANGISFKILSSNFQELINKERIVNGLHLRNRKDFNFWQFQTYDEINEWAIKLANENPKEVTVFNLGKSVLGLDMLALKLSRGVNNSAVFMESGIHAREWLAPAAATWMFNELLTSEDPEIRNLSSEYDFYLVPLVNPDGYNHSWTSDRLWRKNRRDFGNCTGVDLNRNWDFHWDGTHGMIYCQSDEFSGPEPMSEPETQNLDKFVRSLDGQLKLYLSLHTYSQLLLYPWGYTTDPVPEINDYKQIGNKTVEAIAKRYKTKYVAQSIAELYVCGGSTVDYTKGNLSIPLNFGFELRPSGDSEVGFLIDPLHIIPTGKETLDGIMAMIREGELLKYLP